MLHRRTFCSEPNLCTFRAACSIPGSVVALRTAFILIIIRRGRDKVAILPIKIEKDGPVVESSFVF